MMYRIYTIDSRPTDRATVAFSSHKTAQEAMQYDKYTYRGRIAVKTVSETVSKTVSKTVLLSKECFLRPGGNSGTGRFREK